VRAEGSQRTTNEAEGADPGVQERREEAAFWDTHDFADYWDEWKPVRVRFAKNLSEGITIRLDPETLGMLRQAARKKGLGPTTLARMWILERLHDSGASLHRRRKGALGLLLYSPGSSSRKRPSSSTGSPSSSTRGWLMIASKWILARTEPPARVALEPVLTWPQA